MPGDTRPEDYPELEQVVTMAEAARLVHVDSMTVRYAIDAGNVAAVQCGRIWLVSVASLLEWFSTQPDQID